MSAERKPSPLPLPSSRAVCPKCEAASARAASRTDRVVYLRCADCGEVWCIPERRTIRSAPIAPR